MAVYRRVYDWDTTRFVYNLFQSTDNCGSTHRKEEKRT